MKKRIISLILCIVMCFSIVSVLGSCGKKTDALVIMTENLDGLFNPFFSTSANDSTIVAMTQIGMLTYGYENGQVTEAYGDDEPVVVKDYLKTYNSSEDTTTYTFVIKNGIKFSDGHALTIEDVLFNLYVYLDPVYTGSSTMYSTDILGLTEYRTQQSVSGNDGDDIITEAARDRANLRILELVNLFQEVKENNNQEATYDKMVEAINAHNPSEGYISSFSTESVSVSDARKQLLADYERTLALFKEELNLDYESAKDAYTDKPYTDWDEFTNAKKDITSFLYYEGIGVVVEFEKNGSKIDRTKIKEIDILYPNTIDTKEKAIDYVYDAVINSRLDEVLLAWATANKLQTEYTAKAKEVVLHENMTDGELVFDHIEGIKSLGHHTDVTSVTIKDKTYAVAQEHNEDGSPKNADQYDVLEITINGIDPKAIWNFAFSVAPQHYYGEGAKTKVDVANHKYGVDFGEFAFMTDVIQSQRNITVPMGAGAYKATNSKNENDPKGSDFYNSNVVYYKANDLFLLGAPKIEKVRYQIVSSSNALDALESGSVHFVNPQLTPFNEQRLDGLKKKGFESIAVNQLGYGYIGVNAGKIPNIYLRKAILAAMDTRLALGYYSPGTAEQIYWPMSTESWAYPKAEDGSNDKNNGQDYPAINFTEAAAKEKIADYMEQAMAHNGGYTDKDLKITFTIAGSNLTEHPTYAVFQTAAKILNDMGWEIEVIADTQALTKLSTGSLAVWAAAWGSTIDPDMYQVYHKNSTATSVYSWGYREILANPTKYAIENEILTDLSDKIDEARETDDQDARTEDYKEAMMLVMNMATQLPVYQRKDLYAYNAKIIKAESMPEDINPYTSPLDRIWEIEFADGVTVTDEAPSGPNVGLIIGLVAAGIVVALGATVAVAYFAFPNGKIAALLPFGKKTAAVVADNAVPAAEDDEDVYVEEDSDGE